jgi:hypothetical protein
MQRDQSLTIARWTVVVQLFRNASIGQRILLGLAGSRSLQTCDEKAIHLVAVGQDS